MCRGEFSSVIVWLKQTCLWNGWKWKTGVKKIAFSLPYWPLNHECLRKNTQIEKNIRKLEVFLYIFRGCKKRTVICIGLRAQKTKNNCKSLIENALKSGNFVTQKWRVFFIFLIIDPFHGDILFLYSWKRRKTKVFLTLSGVIKTDNSLKMSLL